jgi:putative endonuclease
MKAPHLLRGDACEQFALRWLRRHGLLLICRNYRCRYGELDLVMQDKSCLVIVEVRYRNSYRFGGPLGSVTRNKQKRICLAAASLLQKNPQLQHYALRFDVVALSGNPDNMSIDWRKRAFDVGSPD